ncbi:MAG: sterol desaturase family protein [Caulobacteraceae bacterium]|nr:sterol desaturase family protein [Caulobacteraceae bacterium]
MGPLAAIVGALRDLFAPHGDLDWPGLLAFVLVGVLVVGARGRRFDVAFLARGVFPADIYAHPSSRLDRRFLVANVLSFGLLVAPFAVSADEAARVILGWLFAAFGPPATPIPAGPAGGLLASAALLVAADLGFFLAHLLQHKIPLFWAFHKVHHSAEALQPLTAFRSHPVSLMLEWSLIGLTSGLATTGLAYVFDASLSPATLLGENAFILALNLAGGHLRHSHIALDYGGGRSAGFSSARPCISSTTAPPPSTGIATSAASWRYGISFVALIGGRNRGKGPPLGLLTKRAKTIGASSRCTCSPSPRLCRRLRDNLCP